MLIHRKGEFILKLTSDELYCLVVLVDLRIKSNEMEITKIEQSAREDYKREEMIHGMFMEAFPENNMEEFSLEKAKEEDKATLLRKIKGLKKLSKKLEYEYHRVRG